MKNISKEQLSEILVKHKLWLKGEPNGKKANLSMADLSYAYLSGANLRGADLLEADLSGAKNISCPLSCPEKGSFIAFKKSAYCYVDNTNKRFIIELEIPEDALRVSATGRKCRASKAKVVSITNFDGTPTDIKEVSSIYNRNFKYRVGETVEVDDFNTNRWKECSTGIHFFITREEAVNY